MARDDDIRQLEREVAQMRTDQAVTSTQYTAIDTRLKTIEAGQVWLQRIVVAAILGGFLTFVMKGGLNVTA